MTHTADTQNRRYNDELRKLVHSSETNTHPSAIDGKDKMIYIRNFGYASKSEKGLLILSQ